MRSDLLCTKEINAAQPNLGDVFHQGGLGVGWGKSGIRMHQTS